MLGDRRRGRGRWAGSVLDAVVGVFLTQNVSDALSSKAWMTLAAAFPLRPRRGASPPDEAAGAACLLPAPKPQGADPAAGGAAQIAREEAGGCGADASGAAAGGSGEVQGGGGAGAPGGPGSEAGHGVGSKQAAAGVHSTSAAVPVAQPGLDQPGPPLLSSPLSPVRPSGLEGMGSGAAQQPATPPIREQARAGAGGRGPAAGTDSLPPALDPRSSEAAAPCDSSAAAPAGARELSPVAGVGLKLETTALVGARDVPAAAGDSAGLAEAGGCGGGRPAGGQAWDLVGADAEGGDFGDSIDWEAVRTAPMEKV